MIKIGKKIKHLRNLNELNQTELAKELGIQRYILVQIEKMAHHIADNLAQLLPIEEEEALEEDPGPPGMCESCEEQPGITNSQHIGIDPDGEYEEGSWVCMECEQEAESEQREWLLEKNKGCKL